MGKKFEYVDALRGIAILGVILVHCGFTGSQNYFPQTLKNIISYGAYGVQLFFVISAFTLFLSFENRISTERYPHINFFIRRFFRIAPIFYLAMVYYPYQNKTTVGFVEIISNLMFLHGLKLLGMTSMVPGGWTVSAEFIFYCMLPFLYRNIRSKSQAFIFCILVLIISSTVLQVLNFYYEYDKNGPWQYFFYSFFLSQLPVFSLGIVFYYLNKDSEALNEKYSLGSLVFLFFVLLLVPVNPVITGGFLFGVGFVLLSFYLSRYSSKMLVNSLTKYWGKLSYCMYLIHFAVIFWLTYFNFIDFINVTNTGTAIINFLLRYSLIVIISTFLAAVFHLLVEQPMISLGKRIIMKWEKSVDVY